MLKAACRGHDERLAWLEAEIVVVRTERDELAGANAGLVAERDEARSERDEARSERDELRLTVEALKAKIVELTKKVFGRSSERAQKDPEPTPGPPDASEPGRAPEGDEDKAKRGQQPGRPGHGRRRYDHLPRSEQVHQPDPELLRCSRCGAPYVAFGEERSEEIDVQVVVSVIVHIRPTYRRGCACEGTKGIVAAPPPPKVVPKGRLSAAFLAQLVVAKFLLGLPVSRICTALALQGAGFAPSSLVGALRSLGPLVHPLAQAIRARNASSSHLHIDETSWKVFEVIADKDGYRWWCWIFVGDDTTAYVIKPGRNAEVAAEHLGIDLDAQTPMLPGGTSLLVSSDFATCYQRLGREVRGFVNLYCWAHIRRYFIRAGDAHVALKAWAEAWVALIAELFKAHRAWGMTASGSTEEARALLQVRRVIAQIDTTRAIQAADDDLAGPAKKVLATLDHEWDGLVAFLGHQGIPLENNAAERGLRRPVVIRKACYGSGSRWSAELAGDAWTILASATQNHLNPLAYLKAYLVACAEAGGKVPQDADLERFFPWAPCDADRATWADTS